MPESPSRIPSTCPALAAARLGSAVNEETKYRLLKLLDASPDLSQRDLARELGISVGKANYCLRALIEKGWVKVREITNTGEKRAYAYLLTGKGIEEKARVTVQFLRQKMKEYDDLIRELEALRREVAELPLSRED
jgi:EPS-associated MarR family transcriptional regulator